MTNIVVGAPLVGARKGMGRAGIKPATTAFVLCLLFLHGPCSAQGWKEERGDHFIVYYVNEAAKPKDILSRAEHAYTKVAHDLGYSRYSNFWQWDHRVKIYVHASKESFQSVTGQPAWSDGMASYLDKSIHTIEGTDNFLEGILPH